jgi:hypothetical protein
VAGREFVASDPRGIVHGNLSIVDGSRMTGINTYLRKLAADEEDIVLVSFDLAQATATVSIIDDETLEEMNPEA